MNKFENKHIWTICVIVAIIAICAGILAYKNYKDYETVKENKYNMSFFEVVDYMENVETYLAKSLITKEAKSSAENLIQVWRETNLAGTYLSQIPVSIESLSKTQKFLNQTSEYSYYLFRKNLKDEDLTDEELNKINELHDYSLEVKNTLNQLSEDVNNKRLDWDELENNASTMFSKDISNVSKEGFDTIESNFEQYDGLIYDGAFSEHVTNEKKKGVTGNDIDEEQAKKIATDFIGNDNVKTINSVEASENGNLECYSFSITQKSDEKNPVTVGISKKGGHIVFSNYDKEIGEETISEEKADEIAKQFLEKNGFKSMEKTFYIKQAGVITINYAHTQDDIIIYPDLVKVKIALDNGAVLGIETTGYLNNHEKRNISKRDIITKESAEKNINGKIKIESKRLAVIPTEFKTEIFCWELKGKINERDFLVYVNAKSGEIEDILVITDTGNGTLTM